jgi:hypothetical protein
MTTTATSEPKRRKRQRQVFRNSQECAHVWAAQSQESGRSGGRSHFYFEGTTVFSYGAHFPIADFVRPKIVLFTTRDYSSTTSGHKWDVRRAIPDDVHVIECEDVLPQDGKDHRKNIAGMFENLEQLALKQSKARVNDYREQIKDQIQQIDAYTKLFKVYRTKRVQQLVDRIDDPLLWADVANVARAEASATERRNLIANRRRQEREAEQQRKDEEKLKSLAPKAIGAWRKGERLVSDAQRSYDVAGILHRLPVVLKLSDDRTEIETSHGARISVDTAMRIWPVIKRHETPTESIDGYRPRGWDGDNLEIGCHQIPMSEMVRIAKELGVE